MRQRVKVRGGVALIAAVAAVGLAVPSMGAGTAVAGSTSYSLSTQKLPDGRTVVSRWNPCQVITYRVNPDAVSSYSSQRSAAVADVRKAFDLLQAATGITFRYAGTTTQIPKNTSSNPWYARQTSAEIVVSWVNQNSTTYRTNLLSKTSSGAYVSGTGGFAFKYWKTSSTPWTGATGRGYVVLNSAHNRYFKAGFGSGTTRGGLLIHEIGHAMGLRHVGATSEILYPQMLSRSTTAYGSGDRAGLSRLGRNAGCISVPSYAWSDLS